MAYIIDADDARSVKAIEIAGDAGQWLRLTTKDGERMYGVPSQRDPQHIYFVTLDTCSCEDFRRNGLTEGRVGIAGEHSLCKHVRAVRLHEELVAAVRDRKGKGRRGNLRLVPKVAAENLGRVLRADQIVRED